MAAIDGGSEAVKALLDEAQLPDDADLLGPVDLPPGVRRPPGTPAEVPVTRMLVRVRASRAWRWRRRCGAASRAQRPADHEPVRVQIDPLQIG